MTGKKKKVIYKAGGSKVGRVKEGGDEPVVVPPQGFGILPAGYGPFLSDLKSRIRSAQIKASLASNREMIQLYWDIGKGIAERQVTDGWGTAVVEQLAVDLSLEFPGVEGFSRSNLYRMRSFYRVWTEGLTNVAQAARQMGEVILPQSVGELGERNMPGVLAQLPWFHNVTLIEKLKDPSERLWYAHKTVECGWSRDILVLQVESDLFHRQGKAITNFAATLPPLQSDLAQQVLKDPYTFDFLMLTDAAREREVEEQLVGHVAKLLLEMGAGFAFVGRQVHLEVGEKDYYLDLLFYHTRLHCYVVVELKAGVFKPEYAGKLNFYLSATDDHIRQSEDKPTIGLLLCRQKDKIEVEYALRDMRKPIGVAEWQTKLVRRLPVDLRPSLPTVKEIETALASLTQDQGTKM
jgi:predicted nuclease of restriction endonuclease-like (RecB) superfamily